MMSTLPNSITTYSPAEVARQLTLLDFQPFSHITSSEITADTPWTKEAQKHQTSPNVVKMSDSFNHTVVTFQLF